MLAELLIASICASSPGNYNQACSKATEATAHSLGVIQTETQVTNYATTKARYYLGDRTWTLGGIIGGVGIKVYRDHELSYRFNTHKYLPIDFIAPSYKGFGPNTTPSSAIGVGWSW